MSVQTTISPIDQKPVTVLPLLSESELDAAISKSVATQKSWKKVSLEERIKIAEKFLDEFEKLKDVIAPELTKEMGRPVRYTAGEVAGTLDRATHMIKIAKQALADVEVEEKDGFKRYLKKEPLGVVALISPWNYPYLCLINCIIPALLAGNTLLVKPSPQTPSPAKRLQEAFISAGLPADAFQVLIIDQETTAKLISSPFVGFVSFTGSVAGGKIVDRAAASGTNFKGVALELGGKDPAYVRPDADFQYTVEQLVDGAFFNSGQSCCGIERIYVHQDVYDKFVEAYVAETKKYVLGDPLDKETTIGPVISLASAAKIRQHVADALSKGAKALVSESDFAAAKEGSTYVGPQVLVDVTHEMDVMTEETFGPVVGICKVSSDAEALSLMNDSDLGLTASIWTNATTPSSVEAFEMLASELETGTVFMNRCDALDPALAWTGVKNSGRGISLSAFGYDQVTRLKSIHMKIKTA